MNSVLRVFSYLKAYPLLAIAQLLCASLMAASVGIFPSITGFVVDKIISDPTRQHELLKWVLLGISGFFLKDFLNFGRIMINNNFEQNVIFDIRSDLYKKIQKLRVSWFESRRTGDIMTRVAEDVTAMERVLIDGIELGLVSAIQLLVVAIIMFSTNVTVATVVCIPVPFLILGAWIYSKDARHRHKSQRNAASDLNSLLHDNIAGIRQIKSFSQEKEELTHFNQLSEKCRQASLRIMKWWAVYNPSMSFVQMLGYALVLLFGGKAVIDGSITSGDFIKYFLLISLFYDPITNLRQLNNIALSSRAAADRVFEILDTEDEPNHHTGDELPFPVKGHIQFQNLSFTYAPDQKKSKETAIENFEGKPLSDKDPESRPTLSNIILEAQPGQTIALVGTTGAGKSTLVNLICGFYDYADSANNDHGSLKIDGHELSEISKTSLRKNIGYVTQEAFLFNGTVRQNLLMAKRNATEADLKKALDAARATDFIDRLPQGLDTNVGERGVKLSGGEKQRLSIARALLKDPPILLLDEATASVDSETETLIQQALDQLMKNRTSIVIAHRLSTIQNAHRIHVLEHGQIIESGTHQELLNNNGPYAKLSKQSFLTQEG